MNKTEKIKKEYAVFVSVVIFLLGIGVDHFIFDYLIHEYTCYNNEKTQPIEAIIAQHVIEENGTSFLPVNIHNNLCSSLNDPYADIEVKCDFHFGSWKDQLELISSESSIEEGSSGTFVFKNNINNNFSKNILSRGETCYEAYDFAFILQKINDTCAMYKGYYALFYDNYNDRIDFLNLTNFNETLYRSICSHCFYNVTLHSNGNNYSDNSNRELPLVSINESIFSGNLTIGTTAAVHIDSNEELFSMSTVPNNRKCNQKDCSALFQNYLHDKFKEFKKGESKSEIINVSSIEKVDYFLPPPCS